MKHEDLRDCTHRRVQGPEKEVARPFGGGGGDKTGGSVAEKFF